MSFKYGKLAATRLAGVGTLGTYATGKLPAPPASVRVPATRYPLDGNDTYGDCTMAGVAHLIAAWNTDVNMHDEIPTSVDVVETYFHLTDGQDSGLNEQFVLETWRRVGLFGHHLAAYAPVHYQNIVELHQAVAFYGGAYLGIACPESAQQQFANNEPWTYDPTSPIEGGHCIVALGYTSTALLCATWGGIAEVTYPFLANYLDEAWACVPHQFVAHHGDGKGIDIRALTADLDSLAA